MKSIEKAFAECDNILDKAGMPTTGYVSQTEKINRVLDGMSILNSYVCYTHYQLYNELDHPLYAGFASGATQRLGEIKLNSITTENTFHMEEHYIVAGCDFTVYSKRIKAELTLEDFMGLVDVEAGEGMPTLEHVEIVGTFANLFRKDYERMNPADKDINTYLKDFLTDGEYYHRGYHPFKDFLSAVADVTIILPLVESIVGYDFITGEELTGWERALKGGGAIFDIVTLGSSALIMNAAKAGAWDVVTKAVLKTMAVDAAGSSVAYVTGAALQEMGLPAGTATVLAAIVSGGITYSAGRYFLKDEAGNVIAEYTGAELDRILKGEMDGLEKTGLSAIKGIDNLDSLDGVMIKYKDGKYVISDAAGKEISATGKELDSILKGSAGSINGSSITFKITDIDALKGGTATYRNGKYIICDATGKEIQECTVTELEKILKGEVKSVEGLLDIPAVKGNAADEFLEDVDDIKRIDKIEVEFNYNSKYNEEEFARQLADQQKGMNELTVQEYLDNRQRYIDEGRALESNAAQQAARENAYLDKVTELRKGGLSDEEARIQADEWIKSQAALHNPDQVAGGKANKVDGVGDAGVNSSIGSQWRYRIDDVDEQIKKMAEGMTEAERQSTYLNVSLTY